MVSAEPQAAAQREYLLAHRILDFPRIAVGMLFREGDTHLHWPASMHRVQGAKQGLPHRHHTDHIVEDGAKLFLGFHRIQPLAVAFAVRRGDFQRGVDQKRRNVQLFRPAVDLFPGNFVQPRHRRIGLIQRLLLRHRQHRADILLGGGDLLALEGFCQRRGPLIPVFHRSRHFLPHNAGHIDGLFTLFQWRSPLLRTSG